MNQPSSPKMTFHDGSCCRCGDAQAPLYRFTEFGKAICPGCFPAFFRRRVCLTARRFQMIRKGDLIAVALTDVLADGLSMVYSFYEPDEADRSLGVYMILDHIERARALGLPHVYLGYWVEGSKKMGYKSRFTPQERLGMNGWELTV